MTKNKYLFHDFSIIALSVLLSVVMVKTRLLSDILSTTKGFEILGSFVAGLFFTSAFTTAPAIVTLGEIAKSTSPVVTAFVGSIGAVLGDLIIFRFIKDRLSDHFLELMKHERWLKRVSVVLKLKYFRWLTFLVGGIILASPFPDELGISMLGFSRMKNKQFIQISFIFNFIGILVIGYLARSI